MELLGSLSSLIEKMKWEKDSTSEAIFSLSRSICLIADDSMREPEVLRFDEVLEIATSLRLIVNNIRSRRLRDKNARYTSK